MGAYLNKPVTEKQKEEGAHDEFAYACTTMQGWRASQEDAHNCVVDLHDGWHMFAVYDGHGGTEVSKFASERLPDFLKERKFWESEDIGATLQKAFVEFDDHIRQEDSMKRLKEFLDEGVDHHSEDDPQDEADRIDTIQEASMPFAELIKRYGRGSGGLAGGLGKSLLSSFLMKAGAGDDEDEEDEEVEEEGEDEEEEEEKDEAEEKKEEEGVEKKDADTEAKIEAAGDKKEEVVEKKKVQKRCSKSPIQSDAKKSKSDDSAEEAEPSSSSPKDKESETAADEEDESDQDFVADEDEQEDEEMEIDAGDLQNMVLGGAHGGEVPGEDSGTTACVVLVGNKQVVVANAGDSRAILCRAGKAIDLSVDHKPEDDVETKRIHTAGGTIEDGRVNGGLNLSRAFGDHAYKKNHELELKDQMITAFPDVKIEQLTPEDEFLVVACDGIWNSMESQEVCDFVSKLLGEGKTCGEVCDALCHKCLAETTDGDGTGCDNMTVICTRFKKI